MTSVAILGAGAWGTALATALDRAGHRVTLCVRRREHLAAMIASRANAAHLPGIPLPASIELTDRWAEAISAAPVVVVAVPSRYARSAVAPVISAVRPEATIVSVTKGIEPDTLETMTSMIAEIAPRGTAIAAISGPGFAAEVAAGKPAALLAAARDEGGALRVQELFAAGRIRVYRTRDVVGVELAGAVKNVIAIAAGIGDGLELGSSARAGLITRGLAEITRLAIEAGGRIETVAGLAGLGDLVLTCTGNLSRNRTLGLRIGRGEGIADKDVSGASIAEGVTNAEAVNRLADRAGIEMPIVSAVYRVLYEGKAANAMVEELLSRELKAEY